MPEFWTLDQNSSTGVISPIVEASLEHTHNPEIIFLGSSRFKNGISPLIVAESLGMSKSSVANISFSGGTPLDYVDVYRKERKALRDAKILVINVGARDFNWGRPTTLDNRFRQSASLIQRAQVPDLQKRSDVLAGWIWRTWDARSMLRGYGTKILKKKSSPSNFPEAKLFVDELHRINPLLDDEPVPPQMQSQRYPHEIEFKDFNLSNVHLQALEELVQMARRDGLTVMLLETPLSSIAMREVFRSYASEDAIWRQQVHLSTGLRVRQIPLKSTLCTEDDDCYIDYGHMTSQGAVQYSKAIATWLELEYVRILQDNSLAIKK